MANGQWLVRTPMGDPLWPAVDVVAVVGAPTSAAPGARRPPFGRRAGAFG
jgi:hypothetical protein